MSTLMLSSCPTQSQMFKISHGACPHQKLCMSRCADTDIWLGPQGPCVALWPQQRAVCWVLCSLAIVLFLCSFSSLLGHLRSMMYHCIDSIPHTSTLFTLFSAHCPCLETLNPGDTLPCCMLLERIMQSHPGSPVCVISASVWGIISRELIPAAAWASPVSQNSSFLSLIGILLQNL